ncbi:GNAT family N-acetyltransferase [Chromobacterium sp. IIBBL 290-4]|uniref:GNAT family N-acetyltransferase n=1 Tax=Chromobacterium sp. IIBBL 290-4 TaxID=2953890 RepID=UPI0020B7FC9D|nr:GNAT family N-acetyltransferase [Chromobacterium sp. IIBBL 290-4]UTH74648.1 GNAT family N-acetyltransferase [Chromobacterium sp. IIBBL 290-4]
MNIRPYGPEDWDRVCQIHDAARRDELAAAKLDAAYLTLEETADNEGFHDYTLRVAEVGGVVSGFVAFTADELAWLYVDPATYGRGVGTALIHAALGEARAPMTAEVLNGNDAAVALYRKAGFDIIGVEHGVMPGNESFPVSVTVLQHPGVD